MHLSCGRFIPREVNRGVRDPLVRIAALEWYVARLSEELELVLARVEAASTTEATMTMVEGIMEEEADEG